MQRMPKHFLRRIAICGKKDYNIDGMRQAAAERRQTTDEKQKMQMQFAHRYSYDFAEDSTRVLTIKVKDRKNSRILHSVDFAFVNDYEDDDGYDCQEYIRYNKKQNTYSWSEQSQGFYMLPERFQWIKDNGLKDELDALYIRKKNNNDDPNKHSRSLFAEAVNACYNENCDE